jgi:chromosome segregation ATPase
MTDPVHARVSAVKEIHHGLASYDRAFATALSSARADVNRAHAEMQLVVADSQRQLLAAERRTAMAQAELARCQEGCGALEQAVARARVQQADAQRRLERNRKAQAHLERAVAELSSTIRAVEASTGELVPAGRKFVQGYAEILSEYLASGSSR